MIEVPFVGYPHGLLGEWLSVLMLVPWVLTNFALPRLVHDDSARSHRTYRLDLQAASERIGRQLLDGCMGPATGAIASLEDEHRFILPM